MKKIVLLLTTLFTGHLTDAQTFAPLNAATDVYPSPASNMISNSCYSIATPFFSGSVYYGVYISGWSNNTNAGKIAWRVSTQFAPPSIAPVVQGEIAIGGTDVEVGYMSLNGANYILAAYRKNNVGFVFERWVWNGSAFVPFSSQLLTAAPGKKINMDSYIGYSSTIVWDEFDNALNTYVIKCLLTQGFASTQIITLTGTEKCGIPDVAMTKNRGLIGNGTLEAHVVYARAGSTVYTEVREAVIPFDNVYTANPSSYLATVEDVIPVSGSFIPYLTIDCPDISDFAPNASWAYTYCDNGIKVRLTNPSLGIMPVSKNIVNGTDYPNFNLTPYGTFTGSAIAYDVTGQSIHVGGKIAGSPYSGMFAVEISSDGSTLVSPPDYQLISPTPLDPTAQSLQFSKDERYSSFLYAILSRNGNQLTHLFHQWGDPAFRPGATGISGIQTDGNTAIGIYPNPVGTRLKVAMPAALSDKSITVALTAINGRAVYTGSLRGSQFESGIQPAIRKLPAGTYMLTTSNPEMHYLQTQKIVKAD